MGLVLGGSRSAKHRVFSRQVAAAGDEGQLVCDAVAAGVALTCDWFLQGVLHCAVVRVRVVTGCFRICWLQIAVYNGLHHCCAVAMCVDARRYAKMMLQNAL